MLKLEEFKSILKASLPLKRYKHSVAVYETALELASAHKLDMQKVGIAALLHDCGREIPSRDSLAKAAELGIEVDKDLYATKSLRYYELLCIMAEQTLEKWCEKKS